MSKKNTNSVNNTTTSVRAIVDQYQANCARINQMADQCEAEQRTRTEQENAEYEALTRENARLPMRMQAAAARHMAKNPNALADANRLLRDNMQAGRQTQIMLTRDLVMVADGTSGGIIPLNIQDILDPLTEGLILDKVGLPMPTGLAGDYVWPTYEAVEATIAGEGVELTDTKINMSKLTAQPQRVGVAIPVTRQTIIQTQGIIETIVKRLMPQAVAMLLNKVLFSTTKATGATSLVGPFVGKAAKATPMSATPTFADFVKLKAAVLASGVDGTNLCWVMTQAQKAIAEATPKDAGSGIMVCEQDHIAGIPVFCTHYIGEGYIGLGDWRYQPMGLFGDISFIVDPYSQARKDAVDFVLNCNYGTTTLRPEAFALGKVTAAAETQTTGK